MTNQELIDEADEAMRSLQAAAGQGRRCEAELERVHRATGALSARLVELERAHQADEAMRVRLSEMAAPQIYRINDWPSHEEASR